MLSPSSYSSVMLRPACADDAPFIAAVVMEALGSDVMSRLDTVSPDSAIVEVCRRTDTLYSWCHTCIAAFPDGRPAGALVAYRGENYRQMQRTTFAMLRHLITFDLEKMDDEAQAGEYYIDSVAVLPESRGLGLGRRLLEHAIACARREGLTAVLACDPHNTKARNLYERLGFHVGGRLFIFGEDYLRMVCR